MKDFLTSNSTIMRLARTIVQGIISVIIANIDVVISGSSVVPTEYKAITVALLMAVLSPIMGALSDNDKEVEE